MIELAVRNFYMIKVDDEEVSLVPKVIFEFETFEKVIEHYARISATGVAAGGNYFTMFEKEVTEEGFEIRVMTAEEIKDFRDNEEEEHDFISEVVGRVNHRIDRDDLDVEDLDV